MGKKIGRRISVWIPESQYWMLDVIELARREFESKGIPVSQGEIIRRLLEKQLGELRERFIKKECGM